MKGIRVKELVVRDLLADKLSKIGYQIRKEVKTTVGNIDILAYTNQIFYQNDLYSSIPSKVILIELKERRGIKGAIGQIYSYSKYVSNWDERWLVYFDRDLTYRLESPTIYGVDRIQFRHINEFCTNQEIIDYQIAVTKYKDINKGTKRCQEEIEMTMEDLNKISLIRQQNTPSVPKYPLIQESLPEWGSMQEERLTGTLSDRIIF